VTLSGVKTLQERPLLSTWNGKDPLFGTALIYTFRVICCCCMQVAAGSKHCCQRIVRQCT